MNKQNDIVLLQIEEIMRKERPYLLRYACYRLGSKDDAEAALQDMLLKLHTRMSVEQEVAVKDIRNYIFRTLSNLCPSRLSQNERLQCLPLDSNYDAAENTPDSYEYEYKRVVRLMANIPYEQAEVIRLRIYADKSFAEIASILSAPEPTVKSRFRYGLEKLRQLMKQCRTL